MKRTSLLFGAFAVILTAAAATTIVRCEVPSDAFSYIPHERPRVFLSHHPLRAVPGQPVTIRLTPDLREADSVKRAIAWLRQGEQARVEQTCQPQDNGTFECEFPLASTNSSYEYEGRLELQNGLNVDAPVAYRFFADSIIDPFDLIVLREPVAPVPGPDPARRVDTAWVHDTENYLPADFLVDVETSVYDGILADPVYRWRDRQFGFYLAGKTGFTSSYYSGFDTRCGQNPFPADIVLPPWLENVAILAVLHRRSTTPDLEGGTLTTAFRDCAGKSVKNDTIQTFSVTGGIAATARIAKHEFGHAAFDLGDEYTEDESTRRVLPSPVPVANCCCF